MSIPSKNNEFFYSQKKEFKNEEEEEENVQRCESLKERFKLNQTQLKRKFIQYLDKFKHKHPTINDKSVEQIVSFYQSSQQSASIKKIQKQKERMKKTLVSSMAQYTYLNNKKQSQTKTLYKIKHKYDRVLQIRQRHVDQTGKLAEIMRNTQKQIQKQKIRYKNSIEESRLKANQCKSINILRKSRIGNQMRQQKHQFKQILMKQKQINLLYNKRLHQNIKSYEKQIPLIICKIHEKKKIKANQAKLQKLFRIIAEREEIKNKSSRISEFFPQKIKKLKKCAQLYTSRIKQYREKLGEFQNRFISKSVDIGKAIKDQIQSRSTLTIFANQSKLRMRSISDHRKHMK